MAKSIPALVTPDVLVWARELDSITLDDVAAKMNITPQKIAEWENGTARPTLNQAKSLAKYYRVPFAYFYLPSIPKKTKRIETKDYRTFGNVGNQFPISRELRWFLRDIEERRDAMLFLYNEDGTIPVKFPTKLATNVSEDEIIFSVRNLLGLTPQKQRKFRRPEVALGHCINSLEQYDVLIFQAAKIDPQEMRGVSLAYEYMPIIALNRKEEPSARLFTLCHELVHIVTRTSGICNENSADVASQDSWEIVCNRIAGKILVPDAELVNHPSVLVIKQQGFDDGYIAQLARDFAVSKEVILHRIWDLKMISSSFYFETLNRYSEEYLLSKAKRPKDGFLPPTTDKGTQVGKLYARTILTAYYTDKISASDASSYLLNLKVNNFSKLERWCF